MIETETKVKISGMPRESAEEFIKDVFWRMWLSETDFDVIPTIIPERSDEQKEYDDICGTKKINPDKVEDFLIVLKQPLNHSSCLHTLMGESRIASIERLEALDNKLIFTIRVKK